MDDNNSKKMTIPFFIFSSNESVSSGCLIRFLYLVQKNMADNFSDLMAKSGIHEGKIKKTPQYKSVFFIKGQWIKQPQNWHNDITALLL